MVVLLAADTIYRRLLGTLGKMLEIGCASGAVQLDLHNFLSLNRAILRLAGIQQLHCCTATGFACPGYGGHERGRLDSCCAFTKGEYIETYDYPEYTFPCFAQGGAELRTRRRVNHQRRMSRNPWIAEAATHNHEHR